MTNKIQLSAEKSSSLLKKKEILEIANLANGKVNARTKLKRVQKKKVSKKRCSEISKQTQRALSEKQLLKFSIQPADSSQVQPAPFLFPIPPLFTHWKIS